jgi:hypothetical protein
MVALESFNFPERLLQIFPVASGAAGSYSSFHALILVVSLKYARRWAAWMMPPPRGRDRLVIRAFEKGVLHV